MPRPPNPTLHILLLDFETNKKKTTIQKIIINFQSTKKKPVKQQNRTEQLFICI